MRALALLGAVAAAVLLSPVSARTQGRSSTNAAATAIEVGGGHSCAVTTAQTVLCWGGNAYGQLGDDTTGPRSAPVAVSNLSGVTAVSGGDSHTCALTRAGQVLCWGQNTYGQLGDGTSVDSHTPVAVSGLPSGVQAIAAGGSHTCALTSSHGVMCWGWNGEGELGDNLACGIAACLYPVQVVGLTTGVRAISTFWAHTCALTDGGGVKCWGWNQNGQIGVGTTTYDEPVPVDVLGLTSGVDEIAVGGYHTCAHLSAGGVKCWGKNARGQLGDGTEVERHAPVAVQRLSGEPVELTAGFNQTCANMDTGGVKCWGRNINGELGDGQKCGAFCPFPVDVDGLSTGVTEVSAGGGHECALKRNGGVKCWGWNPNGQLGDSTMIDRSSPVDVVGLLGDSCVVPNVVRKSLRTARRKIVQGHCTIGRIVKKYSSKKNRGLVISQRPRRGKRLAFESKVNLVVGKGPRR